MAEKECYNCGGKGYVEIFWEQTFCPFISNEEAERRAGTVKRTEVCHICGGHGYVEDHEE